MISGIEGELAAVAGGRIELRCGAFTYELLVSAAEEQRLRPRVGTHVRLHARQFLESQNQGASFVPRLIGFGSADERAFFELLTTVKGLGKRRALRAMRYPCHVIAEAIANKDIELLTELPEVGQRTAETIVAELHGKVDRFVGTGPPGEAGPSNQPATMAEALAALVQLGEARLQARRWLERAVAADPGLDTAEELVAAAYRMKEPG